MAAMALVLVAGACTDAPAPLEPAATLEAPDAPFFRWAPAEGFGVLKRTRPLKKEEARSKWIGPEGGTIRLKAGLTLVIPEGALDRPVRITATARPGWNVAFEFAPHGLTFNEPVHLRVDTRNTSAAGLLGDDDDDEWDDDEGEDAPGAPVAGFMGVYYGGDLSLGAVPLETLPVFLDGRFLVFQTVHFSGYAVASG